MTLSGSGSEYSSGHSQVKAGERELYLPLFSMTRPRDTEMSSIGRFTDCAKARVLCRLTPFAQGLFSET